MTIELTSNNGIARPDGIAKAPWDMLQGLVKTLNEYGIKAKISQYKNAPTVITEVGNIIYFHSSGDFRFHYELDGITRHKTFVLNSTGTPKENLIKYLVTLYIEVE